MSFASRGVKLTYYAIVLNWLADFVDLTVSPQALADRLTMAGLEVEGVEAVTPGFSGVVVGKVLNVDRHPQADRLRWRR